MVTTYTPLYEKLDHPEVLKVLFHPRKDESSAPAGAIDFDIVVDDNVKIGARFHVAPDMTAPNILFFHGNGEIVSDYDEIGPMYVAQGLSLLAVDYRGYGRSDGEPMVSAMMNDAHRIMQVVKQWLAGEKRTGPFVVMGRSLGSVSALELAASYQDDIDGLIIESGIAQTMPLLLCLGIDVQSLGITEADGFGNMKKIARFSKPTYILHAQHDQFIPVTSAEALQAQCAARSKEFQMVPGADHNTIIDRTGRLYFEAIKRFTNKLGKSQRPRRPGVRR